MSKPQTVQQVEEPTPAVNEQPAQTTVESDEVNEEVYRTVEEKEVDQEQLDYKPYTPSNTSQHKIPIKYKIWFFVVLIAACICGYYLACSNTAVPVEIVPVNLELGNDGTSVILSVDDLEHIQIDVFKDNKEVKPRAMPTSAGWLYSDLDPGMYIFHTTEVQHSNVKYGLRCITVAQATSYENITDAVKDMVSKLPDEGNKKEICELLAGSFIDAADATGDIETIGKALRDRNAAVLGFTSKPKLQDESVWYDLLKKNGTLFNYIRTSGITIDNSNYKQIFTAIAQGFKEST